jgi:serine/threonine-protein kinase SRK2
LTPHHLAIAMEFAAGGDMFEHVVRKGGLKESEARWFFQQLIVGVDYVHKMVRPASSAEHGLAHTSEC